MLVLFLFKNNMTKKLTQEEAEKRSLDLGIKMIGQYKGCKTKVAFKCSLCNSTFHTLPHHVWRSLTTSCGCYAKQCASNKSKDPNIILKRIITRKKAKSGNSLAEKYPESLQLWDYKKNYPKTPYDINYSSHFKYWIKCNKGHLSYSVAINNFYKGRGCPICCESTGEKKDY